MYANHSLSITCLYGLSVVCVSLVQQQLNFQHSNRALLSTRVSFLIMLGSASPNEMHLGVSFERKQFASHIDLSVYVAASI